MHILTVVYAALIDFLIGFYSNLGSIVDGPEICAQSLTLDCANFDMLAAIKIKQIILIYKALEKIITIKFCSIAACLLWMTAYLCIYFC